MELLRPSTGAARSRAGRCHRARTLALADRDDHPRDPRPILVVSADEDHLAQIMRNLLANAVKYAGDRASVSVEIEHEAPWVSLVIHDDGRQFPAQDAERIFSLYYRSANGSRAPGAGHRASSAGSSSRRWAVRCGYSGARQRRDRRIYPGRLCRGERLPARRGRRAGQGRYGDPSARTVAGVLRLTHRHVGPLGTSPAARRSGRPPRARQGCRVPRPGRRARPSASRRGSRRWNEVCWVLRSWRLTRSRPSPRR